MFHTGSRSVSWLGRRIISVLSLSFTVLGVIQKGSMFTEYGYGDVRIKLWIKILLSLNTKSINRCPVYTLTVLIPLSTVAHEPSSKSGSYINTNTKRKKRKHEQEKTVTNNASTSIDFSYGHARAQAVMMVN